jgi:hydroxymethylglutaryl-CoA lyase
MIRFQEIMKVTKELHIPVRGYLSCAIACPYDGPTSPQRVGQCTEQLLELGCYEVALSDTIGIGTPQSTKAMINEALMATSGQTNALAVHFHDT